MSSLQAIIRKARRRAFLDRALRLAGVGMAGGCAAGLALLAADRLAALGLDARLFFVPIAIGLVAGVLAALRGLPDPVAAAVHIDRAMHLRDQFGSAESLLVDGGPGETGPRHDPEFAALVQRDAERLASRIDVRNAMPIRVTPVWAGASMMAIVLWLGVLFVPTRRLDAGAAAAPTDPAGRQAMREQREALAASIDDSVEQLEGEAGMDDRTRQELEALARLADQLAADGSGELDVDRLRDESAARLNNIADRLADNAQRDLEAREQVARRFAGLPAPPQPQPTDPFTDALRRGDFAEAAEALDDLTGAAASLTPEDRQAAADHLKDLGRRLDETGAAEPLQSGERQAQIDQALRDFGLDDAAIDELVNDVPADEPLRKALEEHNVDPEIAEDLARDIEQLRERRAFDEQVRQDAERLADALKRAAEQVENPREAPPSPPPADAPDAPDAAPDQQPTDERPDEAPKPAGETGTPPDATSPPPTRADSPRDAKPKDPGQPPPPQQDEQGRQGDMGEPPKTGAPQKEDQQQQQQVQQEQGGARPAETPQGQQQQQGAGQPANAQPPPGGDQKSDGARKPPQGGEPPAGADPGAVPRQDPRQGREQGTDPSQRAIDPSQPPDQRPGQDGKEQSGEAAGEQPTPPAGTKPDQPADPAQQDPSAPRPDGDMPLDPEQLRKAMEMLEKLPSDVLRDLARRAEEAQKNRQISEQMREQAQRIVEQMSDEQRRRWMDILRQQAPDDADRPDGGSENDADVPEPRSGAGDSRAGAGDRPVAIRTPSGLEFDDTEDIDLRGSGVGEKVIAEWLSDEPRDGPPGRMTTPGPGPGRAKRIDEAREVAERAVNESVVPPRYHEFIKRYFGNLKRTVDRAAGEPTPPRDDQAGTKPAESGESPPKPDKP